MSYFLLLFWTASREAGPWEGRRPGAQELLLSSPPCPGLSPSRTSAKPHPNSTHAPGAQKPRGWGCGFTGMQPESAVPPALTQYRIWGGALEAFTAPRGSQHKSVSTLGTPRAPPASRGHGLLPGGPGFASVCWPEGVRCAWPRRVGSWCTGWSRLGQLCSLERGASAAWALASRPLKRCFANAQPVGSVVAPMASALASRAGGWT